MDSNYSYSSTLFASPPHHPWESFHGGQCLQTPFSQWSPAESAAADSHVAPAPPQRPLLMTNPSRKRSRDEAEDDDDDKPSPTDSVPNSIAAAVDLDMIQDTGNASTGAGASLWPAQDSFGQPDCTPILQLAGLATAAAATPARLDESTELRPAKSARFDSPAFHGELADSSNAPSFTATPAPAVDAASLMLGIGWKVIPEDDEHLQCAARGWARYVENHYPLGGVRILLRSEGQQVYVAHAVRPKESWWLLKDDLSQARPLGADWESSLAILRSSRPEFGGADNLCAARTPLPQSAPQVEGNSLFTPITGGMEID